MGASQKSLVFAGFRDVHVTAGALEFTDFDRINQGIFIDYTAAGSINNKGTVFHRRYLFCADERLVDAA